MNLRAFGKIRLLTGLVLLSILNLLACAKRIPPEKAFRIPEGPPRVYDLKVINGDGMATIVWKSEKKPGEVMLGYNIYIAPKANPDLTEFPPFNRVPHPGDTDGDISVESFEATSLENGVEYFVLVRSVALDGTESPPSEVLSFVPREEGIFALKQSFHSEQSGFCFQEGRSVPARSRSNDLYFYSKQGENGLGSPSRLGGALKNSFLMDLGTKIDFDKMDSFEVGKFAGREKMVIHRGHVYIIKTQDDRFGKLKVEEIRGRQGQKEALIRYCFQPKPNCGRF